MNEFLWMNETICWFCWADRQQFTINISPCDLAWHMDDNMVWHMDVDVAWNMDANLVWNMDTSVSWNMDIYVSWHVEVDVAWKILLFPFIGDQQFILVEWNTSPIFPTRPLMIDNLSWLKKTLRQFFWPDHQWLTISLHEQNTSKVLLT